MLIITENSLLKLVFSSRNIQLSKSIVCCCCCCFIQVFVTESHDGRMNSSPYSTMAGFMFQNGCPRCKFSNPRHKKKDLSCFCHSAGALTKLLFNVAQYHCSVAHLVTMEVSMTVQAHNALMQKMRQYTKHILLVQVLNKPQPPQHHSSEWKPSIFM